MRRRDSAGWYSERSTVRKRLSNTWCKPQAKPHDFTPVWWVFMAPCCKWWGSALSHCPLGSVSPSPMLWARYTEAKCPPREILYVQDAWSLPQGMPALRFVTLMHIWANLTNLYWAHAVVGYPVPPYPILDGFIFFNFDSFTPWSQQPGTTAQKRFCCFCYRSVWAFSAGTLYSLTSICHVCSLSFSTRREVLSVNQFVLKKMCVYVIIYICTCVCANITHKCTCQLCVLFIYFVCLAGIIIFFSRRCEVPTESPSCCTVKPARSMQCCALEKQSCQAVDFHAETINGFQTVCNRGVTN